MAGGDVGAHMGAPGCEDLGKAEAVGMRWRVLVISARGPLRVGEPGYDGDPSLLPTPLRSSEIDTCMDGEALVEATVKG